MESSLATNVSVPGKQRRRLVSKTARKFAIKDSQRKTALPSPATLSKRSHKVLLFRIFVAGTSFFILLAAFASWKDKLLRTTTRTANRETAEKLGSSLPSHEGHEELLVHSGEQNKSETPIENKIAPVSTRTHEIREASEPRPHQNDGEAQSNPEQPSETLNSFKDLADTNPDEEVSERPGNGVHEKTERLPSNSVQEKTEVPPSNSVHKKIEPVPNFIEWYTRDDYKAGTRPICRISNPIVLSNGTILIPESVRNNVKVLRKCGLGMYSFYSSSEPSGVDDIVDIGVDFALTINLERFQEPTHATSVYLTEHVLKSSFLFDTFEGNARPPEGVKQTRCKVTETEENCNPTAEQKNVLLPGIFVPRRIERTHQSSWPRTFVKIFGEAYGHGNDAVHLNASSILIKSHAKLNTNLVGTRFRSILSVDGMFRHLPHGALQHSRFFTKNNGSIPRKHDRMKGKKCSLTIGISKSSDSTTGFDSSSELKQNLEKLSKFASFANFNVKELETSAVTDFEEYIDQLRELDVFVAGSGEDMATIGFLSPESVVFELMPFGINPETHRDLARALNVEYYSIKGNPKDESFKECIALEIFSLRKRGKLQFSEKPAWHEPVMKEWEAAVADFVISGKRNFDILTAEEPVKNYYSKLCALKQKIEIGVEDATRQILGVAKEMCKRR